MAGYEVDPAALAASGKTIGAQGDALVSALDALESALTGSGLMCGTDPAGLAFFLNYQKGGQSVISAAESAVNATRNVGYGVEVSAHNYAMSDSVSTVGGGRESIPVPAEPAKYTASGIGGQSGPQIPQPSLWSLIQQFVDANWPNGNPETMRTVAAAWRGLGTALSTISSDAGGVSAGLAGHTIPELSSMTGAVNDLSSGTHELAGQCTALASSLESFAGEVQSSQDAIRDLLHRLSASGILDELGKIFTGHNPMDDLRRIGHDISQILHTLSRELDAAASGIQMLIDGMDGLIRKFEEWDRKEFTHFLGDDVGNMVANAVNTHIDFNEGVGKSVWETVGSVPTMLAHPVDTAKGMAEIGKDVLDVTTPLGMLDGDYAQSREHLLDVGKGLIDTKDWSSDRPLVGLGDNVGNIAQMFIPGAGEAKGGLMAGKAGEEAAQAGRAGEVARGGLDALAQGGSKEVAAQAGKVGHDLDTLGSKPIEVPKAADSVPTRPAEPAPAPKTDSVAAAGNSSGGKAPVDVGAKPTAESGAAHGGGAGEAPTSRTPVGEHAPAAHAPSESVPATHGSGEAAHAPVSEAAPAAHPAAHPAADAGHPPLATEHAPQPHSGVPAPHDEPGTKPMAGSSGAEGHEAPHSSAGGHGTDRHGGGPQSGGDGPGGDGPHNGDSGNDTPTHHPDDGSRVYSLMDDSSHHSSFAPEQLADNQRVTDALAHNGVSKSDFIDLINTPTHDLSQADRDLLNAVRNELPHPTADTVMQKVIPPGFFDDARGFVRSRADDYIMGAPWLEGDRVGGAVTVAGDTGHLGTPARIHDDLRLDYTDSPYRPHDPGTHVIRFQMDTKVPGDYEIPRTSDMGGSGKYDGWDDPFTGNGFTKSSDDVIPEYFANDVTMREGAEMWEVLDDGTQRLVAVLKDREWIPQGN